MDIHELDQQCSGVRLDKKTRRILSSLVDRIVPPTGPYPAPSKVGVVDFIEKYTVQGSNEPTYFPFFNEASLVKHLNELGDDFDDLAEYDQDDRIESFERKEKEFFERLKQVTYHGYYSRPEVALTLRKHHPAGTIYNLTPQPEGYLNEMTEELQKPPSQDRGDYTPTEKVTPVSESSSPQ